MTTRSEDIRYILNQIQQAGQAPQSQASLTDQLQELRVLANKAGLYDAADWLRDHLERQ